MSFTIYTQDGTMFIQYFFNMDDLIKAMLKNPYDAYHRNM